MFGDGDGADRGSPCELAGREPAITVTAGNALLAVGHARRDAGSVSGPRPHTARTVCPLRSWSVCTFDASMAL